MPARIPEAAAPEVAEGRPLTGRHVLAMFVAGFGVIVAVNLGLAVSAVRTFPGLETPSSYVASQAFEAERAAQEALGWAVTVEAEAGLLRLVIAGPDGAPVRPAKLDAVLGRPTHVAEDVAPALAWRGGAFEAPVSLAPGLWSLRLSAVAPDGTPFRRLLSLRVAP